MGCVQHHEQLNSASKPRLPPRSVGNSRGASASLMSSVSCQNRFLNWHGESMKILSLVLLHVDMYGFNIRNEDVFFLL